MEWLRLVPTQDAAEPPIAGRLGASAFVHGDSFLVFGGSVNGTQSTSCSCSARARVTLSRVQAAARRR